MGEIIFIHVGQAGVQIGNACWELFCLEHYVQVDGISLSTSDASLRYLYSESSSMRYTPRSIYVDLDPDTIDQTRSGTLRSLFNPDLFISGRESSASNYSAGYYSDGKEILNATREKIRKVVENCDNFQGILLTHSIGGGTGSGFGSLLLEYLSVDFGKKPKWTFTVIPSPNISPLVVEPYNVVFSLHRILENTDLITIFDNESIYEICSNKLNIEQPDYLDVNRIIASNISSLLSPCRFNGPLPMTISEYTANIVPYPRIHTTVSSYSPYISQDNIYHDVLSVSDITNSVFENDTLTVSCDPRLGKYLACCMAYRGDVVPKEALDAIKVQLNKKTVTFVD